MTMAYPIGACYICGYKYESSAAVASIMNTCSPQIKEGSAARLRISTLMYILVDNICKNKEMMLLLFRIHIRTIGRDNLHSAAGSHAAFNLPYPYSTLSHNRHFETEVLNLGTIC